MTTRQNLCDNPGAKGGVTGYAYFSGGSTVVQATGLGGSYPRTTGARFSSSGTPMTPSVACSVGKTYTLSFYACSETATDAVVDLYFLTNGSNTQGASVSIPFATAGAVQRVSITRTVPSGQTTMRCLIDNFNASVTNLVITGVLYEEAVALDTYFDGDSPGASWDGTNGSSTSTLAGGITQALPVATETSAAQSLGRQKTRLIPVASTAEAARLLGRIKSRALPIAAETDGAVLLGRAKKRVLPVAGESSSGITIAASKRRALPLAAELDSALQLGGSGGPGRDLELSLGVPVARWQAGVPVAGWQAGVPGGAWSFGEPEA